ncbi:MAG: 2OG-Fe(II) oxygenase [Hyphomicrobiales bacterium]|nr:2OG-Fe(II) oxygenase [Hyphomicrobiales bacterium]
MTDAPIPVTQLPIIDFGGGLGDVSRHAVLARAIDEAFRGTGFCYFTNTGVPQELIDRIFAASRRFHALSEERKAAIKMNEFHRGYMAPNTSLIETSSVAKVTRPNYSESFMLMHEVSESEERYGSPMNGPNLWPDDLPGFREDVQAYDAALRTFCEQLLHVTALALDLPPDALDGYFRNPTTFLRMLHYPPQPVSDDKSFGSAPHTDYGFITILLQDMSGGLAVRNTDGTWLQATPIPGSFVVNVADMLARWTNGRWQSTPHLVRNISGGDRYSCPYFFDPDMDAVISALPSCVGPDNPARDPAVRYGDYLLNRLDRNYDYRKKAS